MSDIHANGGDGLTWCGESRKDVQSAGQWPEVTCRACLEAGIVSSTSYGYALKQYEALGYLNDAVAQAKTSIMESNARLNQGG